MANIIKILTSFFYLGNSPIIPGTAGSVGGMGIYFLVFRHDLLYAFIIAFLFFLGMLFSGKAEKIYGAKDPGVIVIDEVCGMLIALFLVPPSVLAWIAGFVIFRILDVIKPEPARMAQDLAGSTGIMLDDLIAAVYTNIILQLATRVFYLIG